MSDSSDLYIYESSRFKDGKRIEEKYVIHVASTRTNDKWHYYNNKIQDHIKSNPGQPVRKKLVENLEKGHDNINLPFAGETFHVNSLDLVRDKVIELRDLGYLIDDDLLEKIEERKKR